MSEWNPNSPYSQDSQNKIQAERDQKARDEHSQSWQRHNDWMNDFTKPSAPSNSSWGGSTPSSNSKVICSHFVRKGLIDNEARQESTRDITTRLTPTHLRGYHLWAIPTVKLMRKSERWTFVVHELFKLRMQHIRSKTDPTVKRTIRGSLLCFIGENVCLLLGQVETRSERWKDLYVKEAQKTEYT